MVAALVVVRGGCWWGAVGFKVSVLAKVYVSSPFRVVLCFLLSRESLTADQTAQRKFIHIRKLSLGVHKARDTHGLHQTPSLQRERRE